MVHPPLWGSVSELLGNAPSFGKFWCIFLWVGDIKCSSGFLGEKLNSWNQINCIKILVTIVVPFWEQCQRGVLSMTDDSNGQDLSISTSQTLKKSQSQSRRGENWTQFTAKRQQEGWAHTMLWSALPPNCSLDSFLLLLFLFYSFFLPSEQIVLPAVLGQSIQWWYDSDSRTRTGDVLCSSAMVPGVLLDPAASQVCGTLRPSPETMLVQATL